MRISFGGGMGDILLIGATILGGIINLIILCICVNQRAETACYAGITAGLIIWLILLHISGPIGDCEFTGSYTRGIYYTPEDMDKQYKD